MNDRLKVDVTCVSWLFLKIFEECALDPSNNSTVVSESTVKLIRKTRYFLVTMLNLMTLITPWSKYKFHAIFLHLNLSFIKVRILFVSITE